MIILPTEAFTVEARRVLLLLVALAERLAEHWHHAGQGCSFTSNLRSLQVNLQLGLLLTHLLGNSKVR